MEVGHRPQCQNKVIKPQLMLGTLRAMRDSHNSLFEVEKAYLVVLEFHLAEEGAERADDMSWLDGAGGHFGKHGSKQQKILRTDQSDLEPLTPCEDSLQVQGCIHTCEASP